MLRKTIALFLIIDSIAMPVLGASTPRIPGVYRATANAPILMPPASSALPSLKNILQGATVDAAGNNLLTVHQTQERAIIEWNSFDIGSDATVVFDQKLNGVAQKNWAALNRIYDRNPSQIFGKLSADGKVYLINQNGILFGEGAQVNVSSLIASSLNLKDADFLSGGALKFALENYQFPDQPLAAGSVVNDGNITAGDLGSVFLMGPQVENHGSIEANRGQIGLVAGDEVHLTPDAKAKRQYFVTVPTNPGTAINGPTGRISAGVRIDPATGKETDEWRKTGAATTGMYGSIINQDGIIRSISTIRRAGTVELMATDRISAAGGSQTVIDLSSSDEKIIPSDTREVATLSLTGLYPINPLNLGEGFHPVKSIELSGSILNEKGVVTTPGAVIFAPGAKVTIGNADQVNLKSGSTVDVSGAWVDKAAEANRIEVTLTSENMRDDFGQKNGILKGKKLLIDAHSGSAIGIIDGYLKSQEVTVREQYLGGGEIELQSLSGKVNAEQGATLKFAGGGINYAGGSYATSVLYAGGTAYDIASAPQWLTYDRVGERVSVHPEHHEGADAGALRIKAAQVGLSALLDGRATAGMYQNKSINPTDSLGRLTARGLREPVGGKVVLGVEYPSNNVASQIDSKLGDLVVTANAAPLAANLNADGTQLAGTSYLHDDVLNSAGLSGLEIYSNGIIKTEAGSKLSLLRGGIRGDSDVVTKNESPPSELGGTLKLYGRRIEHYGAMIVPSGTVDFTVHGNITSIYKNSEGRVSDRYRAIDERIFLGSGSLISTSGEKLDLSRSGGSKNSSYLKGGKVDLRNLTVGLVDDDSGMRLETSGELIAVAGSRIEASGGYLIDAAGKSTLGDGGTVKLASNTLLLDGELAALGRIGKKGGSLDLHAGNVHIGPTTNELKNDFNSTDTVPDSVVGQLLLPVDLIKQGGFASIDIKSAAGLTVADGATMESSRSRLALPVPGRSSDTIVQTVDAQFGKSSVKLTSGTTLTFKDDENEEPGSSSIRFDLSVAEGARVAAGPGGEVSLGASGLIDVAGTLEARGGTIGLKTGMLDNLSGIRIRSGAELLTGGYTLQDLRPVATGNPLGYSAYGGGKVDLEGYDIQVEQGALVDISGSAAVTGYLKNTAGRIISQTLAGAPGSLSLSFADSASLLGDFRATRAIETLTGATLSMKKKDQFTPFTVTSTLLERISAADFDSYSLASENKLLFRGPFSLAAGRSMTLDAPEITLEGTADVKLSAPWITLTNSYGTYLPDRIATAGTGALSLSGDWLDINGSLLISGVRDVNAAFRRDIRVFDRKYTTADSNEKWEGLLDLAGNLTLKGDRVYPGMQYANPANKDEGFTPSEFVINVGGDLAILPTDEPASDSVISSAGGSLNIKAGGNIVHEGTLAAPMGTISLEGTGASSRIYLGDKSKIVTGGDATVNYGSLNAISNWVLRQKGSGLFAEVSSAPNRAVTLKADEVIVRDGSLIDISGGGSIYGYGFEAGGAEGTANPLAKAGRFVIVPDNSVQMPGEAVYLEATNGLAAGLYTVLPAQYAFLPGAMVVTSLGTAALSGDNRQTADGHVVVAGYATTMGTDTRPAGMTAYEVRPASDVRNEGHFTYEKITAGDAGALTVNGVSTVLGGTVNAAPLTDPAKTFQGGIITLAGRNIKFQAAAMPLPEGFTANDILPDVFNNQLVVGESYFADRGLREIGLGVDGTTETITIAAGSSIAAPRLLLKAGNAISLEKDVKLTGIDGAGGGVVNIAVAGGSLSISEGATVKADGELGIDVNSLSLIGNLQADNARLKLVGSDVTLATDEATGSGLFLTQSQWNRLTGKKFDGVQGPSPAEVYIGSRSNLTFLGDFSLEMPKYGATGNRGDLTIDAGRIAALPLSGQNQTVTVAARDITITNSGTVLNTSTAADNAAITFTADRRISVQGGKYNGADGTVQSSDVRLDGFKSVTLASNVDLTLRGKGSLKTDADLTLKGARLTSGYLRDNNSDRYLVADFAVESGGILKIAGSGGTAGTAVTPGGNLSLKGKSITQSGTIEMAAGRLTMNATGTATTDGITLQDGGRIINRGTIDSEAGRVELEAATGGVRIDTGASIDVSAGTQGDAGTIELRAATGGVTIGGVITDRNLQADPDTAPQGKGGTLVIDTNRIDDFKVLNNKLTADASWKVSELQPDGKTKDVPKKKSVALFTEGLDIRARQGNLTIAADQKVTAADVRIAADAGNLTLNGTITVDRADLGGSVELSAGNNLTVAATGKISARGTSAGADGGEVKLESRDGTLTLSAGSGVDVSGNGGNKGRVRLRAARNSTNDDVKMSLKGSVTGAREVVAEAVKVETYTGNMKLTAAEFNNWYKPSDSSGVTSAFMTKASTVTDVNGKTALGRLTEGLSGLTDGSFHLRPGVEVRSTGDLTLDTDLDLTSWRFNNEVGSLLLRAANNLNLNKKLVDHPIAALSGLNSTTAAPSWDIAVVAGADLSGASSRSLLRSPGAGKGVLTLANSAVLYSESGDVSFASAGNTAIGTASLPGYMINTKIPYSLASYKGAIRGDVGGSLVINGGAIQSAVGDIRIRTAGDIDLSGGTVRGSIRTTGENLQKYTNYFDYANGGNITLDVAGSVIGKPETGTSGTAAYGWDYAYDDKFRPNNSQLPRIWAASYEADKITKGIAAMGGGDVTVTTGKSFAAQIGTFGAGDLTISSNGNLEGRFAVRDGKGDLRTRGSFASNKNQDAANQVIELLDASASVLAEGDLSLGTVLNPTLANINTNFSKWNLTYGADSIVSLISRNGDVTVLGKSAFTGIDQATKKIKDTPLARILPASLIISAAGNVNLYNNYILAPSADRTLKITAGGSIRGYNDVGTGTRAVLSMPDVDTALYYGPVKLDQISTTYDSSDTVLKTLQLPEVVKPRTYQAENTAPVEVLAGVGAATGDKGNIENLTLYLTKAATIDAGSDIRNLYYYGQNRQASDTTVIRAGRDIIFNSLLLEGKDAKAYTGIIHGGPGNLLVQAGRAIDLGTSAGIQAVGSSYNQGLPEHGSDVTVAAGFGTAPDGYGSDGNSYLAVGKIEEFTNAIRDAAKSSSELIGAGKIEAAKKIYEDTREKVIEPLLGTEPVAGAHINMINSEISSGSGSNIRIITKGAINVGKTSASNNSEDNSGIYTSAGGGIAIYAHGDVNVESSRVMTFRGGDIAIWSDQGDINAGKGSRTAISAESPKVVAVEFDKDGNPTRYEQQFTPPKLGSGLRAVTYDPDGPDGPLGEPEAGNIYLAAPEGTIDAGEAGISGNKIFLAANAVLNSNEIFSLGGSVGMSTGDASVSLGSLSGVSNVADSGKMIEQSASLGQAKDSDGMAKKVDDFIAAWLDVKVINFDAAPAADNDEKKNRKSTGSTEG